MSVQIDEFSGRVSYLRTGIGNLEAAKKYLHRKFRERPLEPTQQRPGRLFYVSIRRRKPVFLLGPYVSHMTALANVRRARQMAYDSAPDEADFAAFGTCSLPREHRPKTFFGR